MPPDDRVPISVLPDAHRIIDVYGFGGAILGHVGAGNYHAASRFDYADEAELETAEDNAEIIYYALRRGEASTNEHGIGSAKTEHLGKEEHGDSLPFTRKIKKLADPNEIMNPDKVFSEEKR